MDGTLSQMIAVCSATTGHLSGRFSIDRFFPDHIEFKFCNSVVFVKVARNWIGRRREVQVASSPNNWLKFVATDGAQQALLHHAPSAASYPPDHMMVAFVGGGGTWSLLVKYPQHLDRWLARWQGTKPDAADRRIWTVTYGLVESMTSQPRLYDTDLDRVSNRFRAILADAESFAVRHRLDWFADAFQRARAILRGDSPITFPEYVDFVCLDGYPELAQPLFAASYAAWVFGGMGSWNDQSFEVPNEHRLYEDISTQLYAIINEAIQHSANSFVMT